MFRPHISENIDKCPLISLTVPNDLIRYTRFKATLKTYAQQILARLMKEMKIMKLKTQHELIKQYNFLYDLLLTLEQTENTRLNVTNLEKAYQKVMVDEIENMLKIYTKIDVPLEFYILLEQKYELTLILSNTYPEFIPQIVEHLNTEFTMVVCCMASFKNVNIIYKKLQMQYERLKILIDTITKSSIY